MGFGRIFLISFIWCHQIMALDSVCLDYLACYDELYMDYKQFEIYHEDLVVRSASACGVLCLDRQPEAPLIMAKMIAMNERLVCGCGGEASLGNHSGIVNDDVFCRNCPDGEKKCGGQVTVSVYRRVVDDEACDDDSYDVPSLVLTTEKSPITTESSYITTKTPHPATVSSHPTTDSQDSTISPIKNLAHLGCYDDNNVNISLTEAHYLQWPDTSINDCLGICNDLQSEAPWLILRLLGDSELFCGCGFNGSLGQPTEKNDCQQSANKEECKFSCPAGTYSAYSYNSTRTHVPLLSLILAVLMAHPSYWNMEWQ